MKVLLKKDVINLGDGGEIKEVAPGYLYNYLLPRGLAIPADQKTIKRAQRKERKIKLKKQQQQAKLAELAKKLSGQEIKIKKKATKKKLLYGQVKPKEIVETVNRQLKLKDSQLRPEMIVLPAIIKKIGQFPVTIELAPTEKVTIKLVVAVQK
jgi:large subunit ribosomal protein L9